jgi:Malectin domain
MNSYNTHDTVGVPRFVPSKLTHQENSECFALCYLTRKREQGKLRINFRTSVERRFGGTILAALVAVLLCMKSRIVESVRLNSSVRSHREGEQFGVLHKRILQSSSPVPASTSELWSLRIDAGSLEDYTDANGTTWMSDAWFGGKGRLFAPASCASSISTSVDGTIYCTQRSFSPNQSNPPFVYRIPVPKKSIYEIRLHFAEIVSFRPVVCVASSLFVHCQPHEHFLPGVKVFHRSWKPSFRHLD